MDEEEEVAFLESLASEIPCPNATQKPEAFWEVFGEDQYRELAPAPPEKIYYLEARKLSIKQLVNLSKLSQLRSLNLGFNKLQTIQEVRTLSALRELVVNSNELRDLEGVDKCTLLEKVYAQDNSIEELPLSWRGLHKLQYLRLDRNHIPSLRNFHILHNLKYLNLSRNNLQGILEFPELKQLESLHLDENCITQVCHLSKLKRLRELTLSGNAIDDPSFCCGLKTLNVLRLSRNHLKSTKELQNLPGLCELYLDQNMLRRVSSLTYSSPLLEVLDIAFNKISHRSDIAQLEKLYELKELRLEGNPCSTAPGCREEVLRSLKQIQVLDELSRDDDDDDRSCNVTEEPNAAHGTLSKEGVVTSEKRCSINQNLAHNPVNVPAQVLAKPTDAFSAADRPLNRTSRPLVPPLARPHSAQPFHLGSLAKPTTPRATTSRRDADLKRIQSSEELEHKLLQLRSKLQEMRSALQDA